MSGSASGATWIDLDREDDSDWCKLDAFVKLLKFNEDCNNNNTQDGPEQEVEVEIEVEQHGGTDRAPLEGGENGESPDASGSLILEDIEDVKTPQNDDVIDSSVGKILDSKKPSAASRNASKTKSALKKTSFSAGASKKDVPANSSVSHLKGEVAKGKKASKNEPAPIESSKSAAATDEGEKIQGTPTRSGTATAKSATKENADNKESKPSLKGSKASRRAAAGSKEDTVDKDGMTAQKSSLKSFGSTKSVRNSKSNNGKGGKTVSLQEASIPNVNSKATSFGCSPQQKSRGSVHHYQHQCTGERQNESNQGKKMSMEEMKSSMLYKGRHLSSGKDRVSTDENKALAWEENTRKNRARRKYDQLLPVRDNAYPPNTFTRGLRKTFDLFDLNRDGLQTITELRDCFKHLGINLTCANYKEIMKSLSLQDFELLNFNNFLKILKTTKSYVSKFILPAFNCHTQNTDPIFHSIMKAIDVNDVSKSTQSIDHTTSVYIDTFYKPLKRIINTSEFLCMPRRCDALSMDQTKKQLAKTIEYGKSNQPPRSDKFPAYSEPPYTFEKKHYAHDALINKKFSQQNSVILADRVGYPKYKKTGMYSINHEEKRGKNFTLPGFENVLDLNIKIPPEFGPGQVSRHSHKDITQKMNQYRVDYSAMKKKQRTSRFVDQWSKDDPHMISPPSLRDRFRKTYSVYAQCQPTDLSFRKIRNPSKRSDHLQDINYVLSC